MQLVRLVKERIETEAHLGNDSISTLQLKGSSCLVDCNQAVAVVVNSNCTGDWASLDAKLPTLVK